MPPHSPTVRQLLAAQRAQRLRAGARATARSPHRRQRRPHAVLHPLAALRARRAAAGPALAA